MPQEIYQHDEYVIRRKILNLFGQKFYVFDPSGNLIGFVKQKAFKLKEDIRVFSDETLGHEILVIKARQIIDFSASYDVWDSVAGEKVGVLRRKGLMSTFIRDTWEVLDEEENKFGMVQEDNVVLALIRRHVFKLLPQGFTLSLGDGKAAEAGAEFKQNWNFFVPRMRVTFHLPPSDVDRRLGLAAAILMCTIEGRQG